MSDYREIRYEVEDQIATLTFNRPEHRNPIWVDMPGEVATAVRAAQRDEGVRVLVITGAGRAFCSGGDVKSMAEVASAGGGAIPARQEQVGLIFIRPQIGVLRQTEDHKEGLRALRERRPPRFEGL